MEINPEERLYKQLESLLGKDVDFWRLIPVGPWEIRSMFSGLKIKHHTVPCPPLPYSVSQLRKLAKQIEEDESQAILTLDFPELGGRPLDLYSLEKWFGKKGMIVNGYLNSDNVPSFAKLAECFGRVSTSPQWRIRYLNLPHWGTNMTYQDQVAEVARRGYMVPSAIADVWSMLLARLYSSACGAENWVLRSDHCGRTSTLFDGEPIIIFNMQFQLGLCYSSVVRNDEANGSTYICCEVPPY